MPEQWEVRKHELEQQIQQAAEELLKLTLADGFTLPLADGRHVAVGRPDYLARATDTSGMQPYPGGAS